MKKHENSNFWENISQRKNENETFLVIFQQESIIEVNDDNLESAKKRLSWDFRRE